MIDFEEKRYFTRIKADCGIRYGRVGNDRNHQGSCCNISGSGILFLGDTAVDRGLAVEIRTLPTDRITPPMIAFIEIVRCYPRSEGSYQIAGIIKGIKSD